MAEQQDSEVERFTAGIRNELQKLLHGRVCIVGVGNRDRGDDGAGPQVIAQHRIDPQQPYENQTFWIDAGATPENYLEPIVLTNPDTVLIVDAVHFDGIPGECRLLDPDAMEMAVLSTHAGSLRMLGQYLSTRTGARLLVLGIQPERIDLCEGLSDPVATSVRELASMLSELLSH